HALATSTIKPSPDSTIFTVEGRDEGVQSPDLTWALPITVTHRNPDVAAGVPPAVEPARPARRIKRENTGDARKNISIWKSLHIFSGRQDAALHGRRDARRYANPAPVRTHCSISNPPSVCKILLSPDCYAHKPRAAPVPHHQQCNDQMIPPARMSLAHGAEAGSPSCS